MSQNLILQKLDELTDLIKGNNGELTIRYLMDLHPELNKTQAESLLKFAQSNTIRHQECYGDGSIIYPKWQAEHSQPKISEADVTPPVKLHSDKDVMQLVEKAWSNSHNYYSSSLKQGLLNALEAELNNKTNV